MVLITRAGPSTKYGDNVFGQAESRVVTVYGTDIGYVIDDCAMCARAAKLITNTRLHCAGRDPVAKKPEPRDFSLKTTDTYALRFRLGP